MRGERSSWQLKPYLVAPKTANVLKRRLAPLVSERHALAKRVAQNEPTVAKQIDVDNLNVGLIRADIVAVSKGRAYAAIALGVVNRLDTNA